MAKKLVTLTFTESTIAEPIIYNLAQQFNLITNIRLAKVGEREGWLIVELEGEEKDIEDGIAWATSKGVRAD